MPLKITNPTAQVGVLNNWADQIETNIRSLTTHSSRHSEAIKVIQVNGTGNGTGSVTSVGLAVPGFLTVSGTPVTSAGVLTIGLAAEPSGTVFTVPPPGLSALEAISANIGRTTGGGA